MHFQRSLLVLFFLFAALYLFSQHELRLTYSVPLFPGLAYEFVDSDNTGYEIGLNYFKYNSEVDLVSHYLGYNKSILSAHVILKKYSKNKKFNYGGYGRYFADLTDYENDNYLNMHSLSVGWQFGYKQPIFGYFNVGSKIGFEIIAPYMSWSTSPYSSGNNERVFYSTSDFSGMLVVSIGYQFRSAKVNVSN